MAYLEASALPKVLDLAKPVMLKFKGPIGYR
jgi:hypothetical protein